MAYTNFKEFEHFATLETLSKTVSNLQTWKRSFNPFETFCSPNCWLKMFRNLELFESEKN